MAHSEDAAKTDTLESLVEDLTYLKLVEEELESVSRNVRLKAKKY